MFQPGAHGGGDLLHRLRILGGDIEVLAEPVDQSVSLDGLSTREHERVGVAHSEDIREEPPV
ncbi:hypothetical protein GCM10018966_060900 [Streptomyces yanii]